MTAAQRGGSEKRFLDREDQREKGKHRNRRRYPGGPALMLAVPGGVNGVDNQLKREGCLHKGEKKAGAGTGTEVCSGQRHVRHHEPAAGAGMKKVTSIGEHGQRRLPGRKLQCGSPRVSGEP